MTAIAVERTRIDVRPLAWAVLLAGGLFVLDIGGWYGYVNDQPSRIVTQIATYVAVGGWLLVAALRPTWLPRTPLARPVTAVAAIFVLHRAPVAAATAERRVHPGGPRGRSTLPARIPPRVGTLVPCATARHPGRRPDRRRGWLRAPGGLDLAGVVGPDRRDQPSPALATGLGRTPVPAPPTWSRRSCCSRGRWP